MCLRVSLFFSFVFMDFEVRCQLERDFGQAGTQLQELHLYNASKWAIEALNGLPSLDNDQLLQIFNSNITSNSSTTEIIPEFRDFKDFNKIQLAGSYMSCKEFERASHCLTDCQSNKAKFLKLYATYLSGEKKRLSGGDNVVQNPYLTDLLKQFESMKPFDDDPFLLYLNAIVLLKIQKTSEAQTLLYQSISLYPFNWSCWKSLISSLTTLSEAKIIINKFKKNSKFFNNKSYYVMFQFFKLVIYQEFYHQSTSPDLESCLSYLMDCFPNFSFLKTQKALILYNNLEYHMAEELFDDILAKDPMRLDDMDTYSNILYVMEKKSKLSYLAHYSNEIDPIRPETLCIIANYYSVKFDHEKAITYYKRALELNDQLLSAWTLMGHEFVELKNSHAAIESYRRAVDTNNKDFRAWYGLGQAYEVMDMHLYSLYYYQRACSLKPLDKRMWQAIGNCCEKLKSNNEAVKAYKKALSVTPNGGYDSSIMFKLGSLYDRLNDNFNANQYMVKIIEMEPHEGISNESIAARLWLAKNSLKMNRYQMAYEYAIELTQGTSQEIEEARAIAREARLKLNEGVAFAQNL